jgi:uncharacterized RDD family membrane protein YckC
LEPETGLGGRVTGERTPETSEGPAESAGSPDGETPLTEALLGSPAARSDWRAEVSQRLHRYQSRRRAHSPRYPSLRLKFETPGPAWASSPQVSEPPATTPSPQTTATAPLASRQAVAVERIADPLAVEPEAARPLLPESPPPPSPGPRQAAGAKIIEFPRAAYGMPVSPNALADPVIDQPRILEAPEVVPPPPALGGIMIEETPVVEPERRPGIDTPLQPAAFEQRALAATVDVLIVLLAGSVFGTIFYDIAGGRPPLPQIAAVSAGLVSVFWVSYQYLLIVYAGTTPGLRVMKLQLQHFDGSPVDRGRRRWRVLGGILSGASLGMGYAWQFLDEDGLCWHERVTKTYLAPHKRD